VELEIRPNTWGEFPNLKVTNARGQNNFYSDTDVEIFRFIFQPERSLSAFEDGEIVGCTTSYSLEMTVPGGTIPIGAVAQVSVQATHRRRGLNTRLMKRQLTDMHEWGDPVAVLQASESVIYGRYGYGMSSFEHTLDIERAHSAYAHPHEPRGRLRYIEQDEARRVFPSVYERATLRRNGMVNRNEAWWDFRFAQTGLTAQGGNPKSWFVKYEVDGRVDGYVRYRIEGETMAIIELMSATDDAYAALWRFCLDMDLATNIKAPRRAADEPLLWMLADPRRLRQSSIDASWLRLVDVPAALSGRTYAAEGSIVLEVRDTFCEWNDGRIRLDGGPEGAECCRTEQKADLTVSAADLGAAYLGAVRFQTMFLAGRIEEHVPGSLARADAMFATAQQPWCLDSW
jgi:predicted acetyltransferase